MRVFIKMHFAEDLERLLKDILDFFFIKNNFLIYQISLLANSVVKFMQYFQEIKNLHQKSTN